MFNLDCSRRGCGIDDDCDAVTQICVKNKRNKSKKDYKCEPRSKQYKIFFKKCSIPMLF